MRNLRFHRGDIFYTDLSLAIGGDTEVLVMPIELKEGQTLNSHAVYRIQLKTRLNTMSDEAWPTLPIFRKRKTTLVQYLPPPRIVEFSVPENITRIKICAFTPTEEIGEDYHNPLEKIFIPKGVETIDCSAFGACRFLQRIDVDADNPFFTSIDGVLFSKDGKKLHTFPAGRMEENYIVPEGVEVIGENAFENSCAYKITMPSTLLKIESDAFWFSYSTIVDFSKSSIAVIGKRIFDDVSNMTVITGQDCFGDNWENVVFVKP